MAEHDCGSLVPYILEGNYNEHQDLFVIIFLVICCATTVVCTIGVGIVCFSDRSISRGALKATTPERKVPPHTKKCFIAVVPCIITTMLLQFVRREVMGTMVSKGEEAVRFVENIRHQEQFDLLRVESESLLGRFEWYAEMVDRVVLQSEYEEAEGHLHNGDPKVIQEAIWNKITIFKKSFMMSLSLCWMHDNGTMIGYFPPLVFNPFSSLHHPGACLLFVERRALTFVKPCAPP